MQPFITLTWKQVRTTGMVCITFGSEYHCSFFYRLGICFCHQKFRAPGEFEKNSRLVFYDPCSLRITAGPSATHHLPMSFPDDFS